MSPFFAGYTLHAFLIGTSVFELSRQTRQNHSSSSGELPSSQICTVLMAPRLLFLFTSPEFFTLACTCRIPNSPSANFSGVPVTIEDLPFLSAACFEV
jgi:hypothetical protein